MVKNVFNTVKNFRGNSDFRASASWKKSWMLKVYSLQWKFSDQHCFFKGKHKLLKNPKWLKIYSIQWKISGETLFSGQAHVDKNPEYKKYIHYSENFQSNSMFVRASASCSKIVNCEKIFNAVYIHLWAIRVMWASLVCNLDQRRDWL